MRPANTPQPNQLELGLFGHARPMVTVAEIAAKFEVSVAQVRNWVEDGSLMIVPVGTTNSSQRNHVRVVRYSAEALYIHRQREALGTTPPYKVTPEIAWWLEQLSLRKTL